MIPNLFYNTNVNSAFHKKKTHQFMKENNQKELPLPLQQPFWQGQRRAGTEKALALPFWPIKIIR